MEYEQEASDTSGAPDTSDASGPPNASGASGLPEEGDEAGIAGADGGPPFVDRWWSRPMVASVAALAAMAALTLVTIVQSPMAGTGSGAGSQTESRPTRPASRSAVPGRPSAAPAPATSSPAPVPATPTSATPATPAPTTVSTTSAVPSRDPAVTMGQAVKQAVTAVAGSGTGDFAVGVAELDGEAAATYDSDAGDDLFDTASIVKVDILAALLLDAQRRGTTLTSEQRTLATSMIEWSDNDAALALWRTLGRAPGIEAANDTLGLHHTSGGPGDLWGLTQTTAGDQLVLLRVVFGDGGSPLSAASRAYIRGLMASVTAEQRWGVSAADSGSGPGAGSDPDPDDPGYALKDGWLRRTATGLWDINSIGRVTYEGHRLLVCVLTSGQPSQEAGIELVEGAAVAAAKAFTGVLAGRTTE